MPMRMDISCIDRLVMIVADRHATFEEIETRTKELAAKDVAHMRQAAARPATIERHAQGERTANR